MKSAALIFALLVVAAGCVRKASVPSTLVVTFESDVTPEAAEAILARYGLYSGGGKYCKKPMDLFGSHLILEVAIPYGEETRWRKRLKKDPGIQDTDLCYEPDR